jgi:C4-dicarboxylate-specific signal transduction histidine kinase
MKAFISVFILAFLFLANPPTAQAQWDVVDHGSYFTVEKGPVILSSTPKGMARLLMKGTSTLAVVNANTLAPITPYQSLANWTVNGEALATWAGLVDTLSQVISTTSYGEVSHVLMSGVDTVDLPISTYTQVTMIVDSSDVSVSISGATAIIYNTIGIPITWSSINPLRNSFRFITASGDQVRLILVGKPQ